MKDNEIKPSATDRLANERTFLAWIRTGLGVVALGFVIMKFSLFISQISLLRYPDLFQIEPQIPALNKQSMTDIGGILLMLSGCLIMIMSFFRYRTTERQLIEGKFNSYPILPLLTTVILVLVVLFLTVYLII